MPQNAFITLVAKLTGSTTPKSLTVDANGALLTSTAGTPGNSSKNYVAANAGDQIKTGAGVLRGVNVNTAGAGSSLVLYDGTSTSGTKLGTFSTAALASLSMNLAFTTGLFAVLAGGTPADVTVSYS